MKKVENTRKKFYLIWGTVLIIFWLSELFDLVTGWSKSGSSVAIPFNDAVEEVFFNFTSLFMALVLSGIIAYIIVYKRKKN